MKLSVAVLSLLTSAFAATVPSPASRYDGYTVFRIPTEEGNHAEVVDMIKELKLETWKYPGSAGLDADVMVSPDQLSAFKKATSSLKMEVMHDNLGSSIEAETAEFSIYEAGALNETWFNNYHSFDDHLEFLKDLQAEYSSNSEMVNVGNSYEDRPLNGIHIWGGDGKGKPAIVWHGTVHAREWISTMVVEYLAWSLLSEQSDPEVSDILNKYDFYLFPVINPDGFVYTQTSDRMWRKNRQPTDGFCTGRDLNRNWPYKWEGSGSSTNPCSETYRGEAPADGPEIQAQVSFMEELTNSQEMKMFVDWHSYSQLWLSPYGYSCSALPPNHDEFQSLGALFTDALESVHGTRFTYGPSCSTIYPTNGDSSDWAFDVAEFEFAIAAELRDTGRYGFILPSNQIKPSGEEVWFAIKALLKEF